ncbi:MAG: hypothetical protein U9Q67_02655, partial [Patescibacteria group bacterium]|nr:hypothetical protein [Patescibacteria group bacterium]
MADITVELIPNKPNLPVSDDEGKDYGELNYIFYPGISECKHIRLTNNTGGALTPYITFKEDPSDPTWWKTLRIYPSCSGVLPSGVFDTYWEGEIEASGVQDLYLYSKCTKEGFSYKYPGTYWTNNGFAIANLDNINDEDEQTAAIDCDAAIIGATLTLDLGEGEEEEFTRIKFSVAPSGVVPDVVNASFDIEYSNDGATWIPVYTDADLSIVDNRFQITFWWD